MNNPQLLNEAELLGEHDRGKPQPCQGLYFWLMRCATLKRVEVHTGHLPPVTPLRSVTGGYAHKSLTGI